MTRLATVLSFVLCCAATTAQVPDALPQRPGPLPAQTRYDPAIPTLAQVNGHAPGERISAHADVERYLLALQAAAPDRMQVVRYGESWQGRGLYYAVVGRPQNVARRDAIRTTMQRLADPRGLSDGDAEQLLQGLPAVGWLANCVHGDEPSGTDAALCVLYHLLAAQGDPVVDKVLDECLVLIDPLENPDGRDRFVFYTRAARGRFADPTPESAEHSQPWPTGRSNHALFDMNRDWFAMSQPETAARVAAFLDWWPLVYVDLHEMGGNSSYYFPPPSQPVNREVTATQRQWLERYGRNNARWFDRYGFDYFTRESYDGFYPGYGDAWPMAHGSVGMTFEMASARGLVYRRSDEQLLLYRDGVRRHFTASMATLETLAGGRVEAQRAFLQFRRDGVARGQEGAVRSYVLPAVGDRTRLARLADLMVRQGIEVQVAENALRSAAVRALGAPDDAGGEAREFAAGAFVVSMAQPASALATMLLRPHFDMEQEFLDEQRRREAKRRDLEFYDLTAWSLPLLFGVECVETLDAPQGRLRKLRAGEASSGAAPLRAEPPKVAYVVAWGQNGAAALLAELLRLGVRARCIDEPFSLDGQRYPAGSFVVRVVDQPELPGGLHQRLGELAAAHGVTPYCADSSWVDEGPNFGTGDGHTLKMPKLLMAWDRPVNTYSAGWLRYLLEQRYGLPVSVVRTRDLGRVELDRFTVLLLPEGGDYGDELGERGTEAVVGFVERGGVLVALGSATRWLMDEKVGLLASAAEPRKAGKKDAAAGGDEEPDEAAAAADDEADDEPFDYEQAIRPDDESPPSTPGAILRVTVDGEHWLGFGYDGGACVVHDSSNILTPVKLDRGRNVAIYQQADQLLAAGFSWPDSLRQLPQKAYLVHQPKGRGHVVAFAEDPNVRAFADGLNLLLLNAVLLTAGR